EEARFHARRQPLDHAQHPRYLILGERNPPGARYGHDLADRALEQPPAERMSAERAHARAGEAAGRGERRDEHEFLPQLDGDAIRGAGVGARFVECRGDAADAVGHLPVELAHDDVLKWAEPLYDARLYAHH